MWAPRIRPASSIPLLAISVQESAVEPLLVVDRTSQQEHELGPHLITVFMYLKVTFSLIKRKRRKTDEG